MMEPYEREGLEIEPLHEALGARVRCLDLTQPLSPAVFKAVHRAWLDHLVLVFPEQPVSDMHQITFARMFGDLERHHQDIIKSTRAPEIFRVSNVEDDGNLMAPDHPTVLQVSLAQRWHTDSSYRLIPSMGSILHGLEVTEVGGETCFTNMYAVYDALPDSLGDRLCNRRLRHDFEYLTTLAPIKPLTEKERAVMPPVWQPMRRRHPETGRTSLYVNELMTEEIIGMPHKESRATLDELFALQREPRFLYEHVWQLGDLVMWDNRCTLHARTDFPRDQRRLLRRITIEEAASIGE